MLFLPLSYLHPKQNSSSSPQNVCMIVTAYGRSCPFKNRVDNVGSADMWLTALDVGAMTMRYEEKRFNEPFFVSVVVPETDAECSLEGGKNGGIIFSANRTKVRKHTFTRSSYCAKIRSIFDGQKLSRFLFFFLLFYQPSPIVLIKA